MTEIKNIQPQGNCSQFMRDAAQRTATPFYFYDIDLLHLTIEEIKKQTAGMNCIVHYALKANSNKRIINEIAADGLGADLVSGGEIRAAMDAGFHPQKMTFSGVGKTDWEIRLGLECGIGNFNVESVQELEVIDAIAGEMGKTAHITIRVNPDIDAHTHRYITTATADDKFGINIDELHDVVNLAMTLQNVRLMGLHFHIGSQITDMSPYIRLCECVNTLQDEFEREGISFEIINMGGGLGIDYMHPDECPIPDFKTFFDTFKQHFITRPNQSLHFELGRSIVAGCGTLVSRVTFIKQNRNKRFAILDAGMTDLIRPALYGAHHEIQNLNSSTDDTADMRPYDVVGPVCESSDVFSRDCMLPETRRGNLIAIRSVGAYGESMASHYNMRELPKSVFFSRR